MYDVGLCRGPRAALISIRRGLGQQTHTAHSHTHPTPDPRPTYTHPPTLRQSSVCPFLALPHARDSSLLDLMSPPSPPSTCPLPSASMQRSSDSASAQLRVPSASSLAANVRRTPHCPTGLTTCRWHPHQATRVPYYMVHASRGQRRMSCRSIATIQIHSLAAT